MTCNSPQKILENCFGDTGCRIGIHASLASWFGWLDGMPRASLALVALGLWGVGAQECSPGPLFQDFNIEPNYDYTGPYGCRDFPDGRKKGLFIGFEGSEVTCNNLGGLGGGGVGTGTETCLLDNLGNPAEELRYAKIGADYFDGFSIPQEFDLVITNLT
eukprot:CAMPEP_0183331558 /NCGR_PEP_ID=MMETSP0164_2-20130417/910_1 /TAXON_ID=221442 /ORGANISM="Coccolithus pelagicus ssp braarudi, Strain PLY182g" /LENGTH=159 /DNA_ID=CAMNT_0025500063 /DNA_START=30 /DNA_END=506 /DNA_ORIENTATION=-